MEDKELLQMFITEASEHLENADNIMVELENDPENKDKLNELFRALHTIKGGAGFLNLSEINVLAHKMETLLDQLRSGQKKLTPDIADVIFEGLDLLRQMVENLDNEEEEWQVDIEPTVNKLLALIGEEQPQKKESKKEKKEEEKEEKKEEEKQEDKPKVDEELLKQIAEDYEKQVAAITQKAEEGLKKNEEAESSKGEQKVDPELLKKIAEEYEKQVKLIEEEAQKGLKKGKQDMQDKIKQSRKEAEEESEKVDKEITAVVFEVNNVRYYLPAEVVMEITEPLAVTVVPNTPLFVDGVANLRGTIVTIFTKEVFFETPEVNTKNKESDEELIDDEKKVIIIETKQYGVVGVEVDKVIVVKQIKESELYDYPGIKGKEFFVKLYKEDDRVVIGVDFERMLQLKTEREWLKEGNN